MILIAALSIVRLALLAGYCTCVALGSPWWGVPMLVVFVIGAGCKPPDAIIKASPAGKVNP